MCCNVHTAYITFVYRNNISVHKYMKNQTIFTVPLCRTVRKYPSESIFWDFLQYDKRALRQYAKQYLGVHDSTFYDWVNCRRSPSRFRLQKIQMIVSHKMNKRHGASQH